jgi:phosphoserine phosphatase RsbU/P
MATIADSLSLSKLESQREQELGEARAIQRGMLPRGPLSAPEVAICHEFQPFHEVGGDFLDFFTLTDGTVGIYLGDVTGKGLPAALYAALTVGTLRGVHKTGTDPATVLRLLNRRMMLHSVSTRYAAVQYACIDPRTGIMRIASAGMPGPLHLGPSGCREFEISGLPPGMFPTAEYESVTMQLAPGDSVVFFSDGLCDTQNDSGELFGMERMHELCRPLRDAEPDKVVEALMATITSFSAGQTQQDDRTAAVLRYLPGWQTRNVSGNSN